MPDGISWHSSSLCVRPLPDCRCRLGPTYHKRAWTSPGDCKCLQMHACLVKYDSVRGREGMYSTSKPEAHCVCREKG